MPRTLQGKRLARMTLTGLPSVQDIATAIDWPLDRWPGNCFAVCSAIQKHNVIQAAVRYGFYYGPIAPSSHFNPTEFAVPAGFKTVRHGWMEYADGTIIDPTRWVFENDQPYLCVAPNPEEYDLGMNRFHARQLKPPPADDTDGKSFKLVITDKTAEQFVRNLFGKTGSKELVINEHQLFYLGNFPLHMFQGKVSAIYQAIINAGRGAVIPLDNRTAVMDDGKYDSKPKKQKKGGRHRG